MISPMTQPGHSDGWPPSWNATSPESSRCRQLEGELAAECGPGHPLHAAQTVAVAERTDQDDVAFYLLASDAEQRWVVVHLTWKGSHEGRPEWPTVARFHTLAGLQCTVRFEDEAGAWAAGADASLLGRWIAERTPTEDQPRWSAAVLSVACERAPEFAEVATVVAIAGDPHRWPEAHEAFTAVRRLALGRDDPEESVTSMLLRLAELAAKATYNASGEPAPFDSDSSWWIPQVARRLVDRAADSEFEERMWLAVTCALPHEASP